jgi:hypothetical protein
MEDESQVAGISQRGLVRAFGSEKYSPLHIGVFEELVASMEERPLSSLLRVAMTDIECLAREVTSPDCNLVMSLYIHQ